MTDLQTDSQKHRPHHGFALPVPQKKSDGHLTGSLKETGEKNHKLQSTGVPSEGGHLKNLHSEFI
jgi:hypothetical protein